MKDGKLVFTRIARRYDRLNAILSLGRDQHWRRTAVDALPAGRLLDLGGGTGAANAVFGDREVVALDPSPQMLALNGSSRRVIAAGERLPFADGTFDAVFSAYVFRNLESLPTTLAEIGRVLRPGGKAAIVDLGRPAGRTARALHRAGTFVVLPLAGLTIGAPAEYTYLHRSLDRYAPPERLYAEALATLPGEAGLQVEQLWRMGPLGFVHTALLARR